MSLRVFVTGGTFDKEYDEITGSLSFCSAVVVCLMCRSRC